MLQTLWFVTLMWNSPPCSQPFDDSLEKLNRFIRDDHNIVAETHYVAHGALWDWLPASLRVGGLAPSEITDPIRPSLWQYRACLIQSNLPLWLIQSPKDLQGVIEITSLKDASEYLACFSRISTIRLFTHYHFVEVRALSDTDKDFAHADLDELSKQLGPRPRKLEVENGRVFQFIRFLVEYDDRRKPMKVHATFERVSREGHYELTMMRSLPFDNCDRIILLPRRRLPY